jgi:hypothetical protein
MMQTINIRLWGAERHGGKGHWAKKKLNMGVLMKEAIQEYIL